MADLRGLIRLGEGRTWAPSAAVLDSRTLRSTASSEGAAYDGAKRVKGRKLHLAIDTLGHLLAAIVNLADAQDRAVVAELCAAMQAEVDGAVTAAFVDQGYTGAEPRARAAPHGVQLLVVKHAGPRRGFVLLPRRWVVERTFAWMTDFRRLNRDYERLAETLRALFRYIEGWYNPHRRHSALGRQSPLTFERRYATALTAPASPPETVLPAA